MCVCVCVFWIYECFALFFMRDVFESLTCWLDLCLSSLLVCIHLFVFFLSLKKLFFIKLNSFLTDSRQIPIYRAPWTSFLDKSYCIFNPSSFLDFVLTASRSIEKLSIWPIDSRHNLDPSRNFCHRQILNNASTDSYLSRFSARQISTAPWSVELQFLYIYIYIYICSAWNHIYFFTSLLTEKLLSSSKHLSLTPITLPICISA